MKELLLNLITETKEELTRLAYEKTSFKEVEKRNEKKLKAYNVALSNGLVVEEPVLEPLETEQVNEDIKLAKAVLVRLETLAEKFIQE